MRFITLESDQNFNRPGIVGDYLKSPVFVIAEVDISDDSGVQLPDKSQWRAKASSTFDAGWSPIFLREAFPNGHIL